MTPHYPGVDKAGKLVVPRMPWRCRLFGHNCWYDRYKKSYRCLRCPWELELKAAYHGQEDQHDQQQHEHVDEGEGHA